MNLLLKGSAESVPPILSRVIAKEVKRDYKINKNSK